MAFLIQRLANGLLSSADTQGAAGVRQIPECLVLKARKDTVPSPEPPVRIFLGTEAAHHRATRTFIWSIEKYRDRSRTYEIYLMQNLAGFRPRFWLTGFTNYRFAIPDFAGRQGRAIYNDVDQIYLTDPAELFDQAMDGHGYLSVTARDTSVMLLDCERMGGIWSLDAARQEHKNTLLARAETPGLWGQLAPEWNARNDEYTPGRSKLIHYTILQTQPWRPFPRHYVYQQVPEGRVWLEMEAEADRAGFQVFSARQPSTEYGETLEAVRALSPNATWPTVDDDAALCELLAGNGSRALLKYGLGAETAAISRLWGGSRTLSISQCDPALGMPPATQPGFDGIVCKQWLEYLPDADVPWQLEHLFAAANALVSLDIDESRSILPKGLAVRNRTIDWWLEHLEAASRRHPHIHWRLRLRQRHPIMGVTTASRAGGRPLTEPPRVWVLTHRKPGHTHQATGLAEALGWPYETKPIPITEAGLAKDWLINGLRLSALGIRSPLAGAWSSHRPDLMIAAGWFGCRVARRLQRLHGPQSRLVLMGRKAGAINTTGELMVSCEHFRLPPHPRRIETPLPIHPVTPAGLQVQRQRWPELLKDEAHPRILLLVGGTSKQHQLDADTAACLLRDVQKLAGQIQGSVFVITSRRTGAAATEALKQGLPSPAHIHEWRADRAPEENPYLGYLAQADALVVTGESESMLAEAVATGKPVQIYPLPRQRRGPWQWLSAWIAQRAWGSPLNRRGTVRPQQGLEYLCARLIERGLVLPPRDLNALHHNLVEAGLARMFGGPLAQGDGPPLNPTRQVADQVIARLGWQGLASIDAARSQPNQRAQ